MSFLAFLEIVLGCFFNCVGIWMWNSSWQHITAWVNWGCVEDIKDVTKCGNMQLLVPTAPATLSMGQRQKDDHKVEVWTLKGHLLTTSSKSTFIWGSTTQHGMGLSATTAHTRKQETKTDLQNMLQTMWRSNQLPFSNSKPWSSSTTETKSSELQSNLFTTMLLAGDWVLMAGCCGHHEFCGFFEKICASRLLQIFAHATNWRRNPINWSRGKPSCVRHCGDTQRCRNLFTQQKLEGSFIINIINQPSALPRRILLDASLKANILLWHRIQGI